MILSVVFKSDRGGIEIRNSVFLGLAHLCSNQTVAGLKCVSELAVMIEISCSNQTVAGLKFINELNVLCALLGSNQTVAGLK